MEEPPVIPPPEDRGAIHLKIEELYGDHAKVSPAERQLHSYGRSLGYVHGILQALGASRVGTTNRPFRWWVLGATDEVEGTIAKLGGFNDTGFVDRAPCEVVLWGQQIAPMAAGSRAPAHNEPASIHSRTYHQLGQMWSIPKPDLLVVSTGLEQVYQWIQMLPKQSTQFSRLRGIAVLIVLRSLPSEAFIKAIVECLGDKYILPVMRNRFSALAGDPIAEYDENGWIFGIRDITMFCKATETVRAHMSGIVMRPPKRSTALFWGILDLKYDPSRPITERVKILETGDGRTSRFSNAGADIPKRFRERYRLEDGAAAGKHAVVSANKKLTHDLMEIYGYAHLVPSQVCIPRVYREGLADEIIQQLGVTELELVVLKLCNRTRAAGVLPVPALHLDSVLREVLQPPDDLEGWFQQKLAMKWDASLNVEYGCFEEQLRHWWSNECPYFVVEQFCTSILTEYDGKMYDGTMRVAFALCRRPSEDGSSNKHAHAPPNYKENPLLEYTPPAEELYVDWLGGYWKLPKEDVESDDIRKSVISAARTAGTAHVPPSQLAEVYAAIGDAVQRLFGGTEPSTTMLAKRYAQELKKPVLAAYLTARLAISMRDLSQIRMALKKARELVAQAENSPEKSCCESFVHRGFGVVDAMTPPGKWDAAKVHFQSSLECQPSNASSLYLLGTAEMEVGNTEKGVDLMNRSLILDLDFKAPYVCLGVGYLRLQSYDAAIAVSEACLKRHPQSPQCEYHIGIACYQKMNLLRSKIKPQDLEQLRQRALAALSSCRESEEAQKHSYRRNGSPWLEQDDRIMEIIKTAKSATTAKAVDLPTNVGWCYYGWRN